MLGNRCDVVRKLGMAVVTLALVAAMCPLAAIEAQADVQVNTIVGGGAEPADQDETTIVHFKWTDPARRRLGQKDVIVAAWNDFNHGNNGFADVGYGRSENGGAFDHSGPPVLVAPPPAGRTSRGDPVLAVDYHFGLNGNLRNPRVYLVQLAAPSAQDLEAVYVSQSDDGGTSFSVPAVPNASGVLPPNTEDDKPWIAVDQRGGVRPPDGNVYVCWTRFRKNARGPTTSQIMFSQIDPAGVFAAPIGVSLVHTLPDQVQNCEVAVDFAGHVYVVWIEFARGPKLMIAHANPPAGAAAVAFDDNGQEAARLVLPAAPGANACAAPDWLPFNMSFALFSPSLATNPVSGDVYLTYESWNNPERLRRALLNLGFPRVAALYPNRRFDVFFKSAGRPTINAGNLVWRWSAPVIVNDDANPSPIDQWMPAITTYPLPVVPVVRPIFGPTIKIQWYDKRAAGASICRGGVGAQVGTECLTRADAAACVLGGGNCVGNHEFEVWSATSGGGGRWGNRLVSRGGLEPLNSDAVDCRAGDYNGITSGNLSVVGPDGRGNVLGANFMHVWTDTRNNAATDPEIFYATQPTAPILGDFPLPPRHADTAMVSLDVRNPTNPSAMMSSVQATVGAPTRIAVEAAIAYDGPSPVVLDTWRSVSAPPEVTASWVPESDDRCMGAAPADHEGPLMPEVGIDCSAPAEPVDVLGEEDAVSAPSDFQLNRTLTLTCQREGSFVVTIGAGTEPVYPMDLEESDLSDNSQQVTIQVECQAAAVRPHPRPRPTPGPGHVHKPHAPHAPHPPH